METNFQSQGESQDNELSQEFVALQKDLTTVQQQRAELEAQLSTANAALGQLQSENQILTAGGLDEARQQYESRAKELEQGFLRREFDRELDQSGFSPDPDHRDFLWHRASQRLGFKGDQPVVLDAKGQMEYTAVGGAVRPQGIPDLITQFQNNESTRIFFNGASNAGPAEENGVRSITHQQSNDRSFLLKEGIDLVDIREGRVRVLPPGQSAPPSPSTKPATTAPTQPQSQQQVPQLPRSILALPIKVRQWCAQNNVDVNDYGKMISVGKIQVIDA